MSSFGKGTSLLQANYGQLPEPYLFGSRNKSRNAGVWYEPPTGLGSQTRLKITGQTQDKDGNPLGGVTVQGFRTSDDYFVGEMVSDSGGYYEFCSPYNVAHYLVIYKTGAPDVTGSSVNTLVPA